MEEPAGKKRFRISPLFLILIAISAIYYSAYLFFRINHDIVHIATKQNGVEHIIMTNMPTSHELFLATLVDEKNSENVDGELQKKIDFHKRKKKYLDIIFYPAFGVEKKCWELSGD